MRFMALACVVLTVLAAGSVRAEGEAAPERDEQKSSKGFGGLVLLTPDADWEQKWAQPTPPQFKTTEVVKRGQTVTALLLFSNPAVDKDGRYRILCDYLIVRPDGSVSFEMKDNVCAEGPLEGPPGNVRLVSNLIGFTGEDSDLPGTWTLKFRLTDSVRNASVDLKTKFEYVK